MQQTVSWWKNHESYCDQPNYASCRELNQQKKYFAKPDLHYLNELKAEDPPMDDFKKNRKMRLNRIGEEEKKWDKPNSKPLPDDVDALKPKT